MKTFLAGIKFRRPPSLHGSFFSIVLQVDLGQQKESALALGSDHLGLALSRDQGANFAAAVRWHRFIETSPHKRMNSLQTIGPG